MKISSFQRIIIVENNVSLARLILILENIMIDINTHKITGK